MSIVKVSVTVTAPVYRTFLVSGTLRGCIFAAVPSGLKGGAVTVSFCILCAVDALTSLRMQLPGITEISDILGGDELSRIRDEFDDPEIFGLA